MATNTTRMTISKPAETDAFSGLSTSLRAAYDRIDLVSAMYSQGTLASRPSAAIAGRFYIATDAGAMYYDTGSAWLLLARTPLSYTNAGPATLLAGSFGVLISALHLSVAGTWRFTLSADFMSTGTDSPRTTGLDIQVYNGFTVYRAAGTGDQLQIRTIGTTASITGCKQFFVTTPGVADVDLYGYVSSSGGQASNIKLYAELIA